MHHKISGQVEGELGRVSSRSGGVETILAFDGLSSRSMLTKRALEQGFFGLA